MVDVQFASEPWWQLAESWQLSRRTFDSLLSRFALPGRQPSMSHNTRAGTWLTAVVLAHLAISFVHGQAHAGSHIALSPAANIFVLSVILAGPLISLGLTWPAERIGNWVIAVTMAASLVFGVVNHFVVISADHVAYVDPRWRLLFATSAVLLAVTETIGSGLAIRSIRERSGS